MGLDQYTAFYKPAAGDKKPDPNTLFTNEFVGKLRLTDAEWAKVKAGTAKYALG